MKILLLFFLALCPSLLHAEMSDAEALAFLKKDAPEVYQKVAPREKADPHDFRSAIDEAKAAATEQAKLLAAGDTTAAAAHLKMYVLDFKAITLADQIALNQNATETETLKQQLATLIAASLEQWAIVEQSRIRRLEAELNQLRTELKDTLSDKAKTIEKDTAALIEECRQYQKEKAAKAK